MLRRIYVRYELLLDVAGVCLVALFLRLWGLSFDLPYLYHPDEYPYVAIALNILKTGDYNPHFFNYPSLFFYVLAAAYIPYFLLYASRGMLRNLDGLTLPMEVIPRDVALATMPSQFLVGRMISVVFALATVALIYLIGRELYNRRVGFIAALLLAVSFTHVRISHFITPDVIMTFFVTLSVILCWRIVARGRLRDYLLAGAAIGLAATTKYNAGITVLLLLLAHVMSSARRVWLDGKLVAAIALSGVVFVGGSPYSILDLSRFLNDLAFEVGHYSLLSEVGQVGSTWSWYIQYLWGKEGVVLLLAGLQTIRAGLTRSKRDIYVAAFTVGYFCFAASYIVRNDRTLAPVLPALGLMASILLDHLATRLCAWQALASRAAMRHMPLLLLVGIATSVSAFNTVQLDRRLVQGDVRTEAGAWVEQNLPAGSRIVVESYSPMFAESVHHLQYRRFATDETLAWYRQNQDYLVLYSRGHYAAVARDPRDLTGQMAQYQDIFSSFTLLREFAGSSLGYPFWVRVYQVQ